jgi:hypothetical protein
MVCPQWPTAPAACGARIDLRIVSSVPAAQATGIRLLLGSDQLRTVDFATGRAAVLAQPRLRPDEFIQAFDGTAPVYATGPTLQYERGTG